MNRTTHENVSPILSIIMFIIIGVVHRYSISHSIIVVWFDMVVSNILGVIKISRIHRIVVDEWKIDVWVLVFRFINR